MSSPALARRLGLRDAVVIGLGSMVGAGVFVAFAPAASAAGSPGTPDEGRKETAQSAHQAGTTLAKAEDPDASEEERDTARKKVPGQIDRMEKELE